MGALYTAMASRSARSSLLYGQAGEGPRRWAPLVWRERDPCRAFLWLLPWPPDPVFDQILPPHAAPREGDWSWLDADQTSTVDQDSSLAPQSPSKSAVSPLCVCAKAINELMTEDIFLFKPVVTSSSLSNNFFKLYLWVHSKLLCAASPWVLECWGYILSSQSSKR
jgi:hypothetical protein